MNQHLTGYVMAALTILYALSGYLMLQRNKRDKAEIILTGFLGGFVLIAGAIKLIDPFATMFFNQIAVSPNPVPGLTRWLGQSGEISIGILMLVLALCRSKLPQNLAHYVFVLAHVALITIGVADYSVQYFYDITTIILPIDFKPQVLGILLIALAYRNLRIHWINQYKDQRKSVHKRHSSYHL
ncbi:hypothetical protein L3Q72_20840 [Vibrio sp. JC009]|uniref:hypothetical protein n=1 Tax=Vibrio sp. JC009 TaxID=2912314 RepID=UPI0023AFAA68|nr:hypothetical protein [Vibrio sp. JC009]WED23685.1 hypothetical protein L3Q72_20840 [Vibrio sp. JC009]